MNFGRLYIRECFANFFLDFFAFFVWKHDHKNAALKSQKNY